VVLPQFIVPELKDLCRLHGERFTALDKRPQLLTILKSHVCNEDCEESVCLIMPSAKCMTSKEVMDVKAPAFAASIKLLILDIVQGVLPVGHRPVITIGWKVNRASLTEFPATKPVNVSVKNIPLIRLASKLTLPAMHAMAYVHSIFFEPNIRRPNAIDCLKQHVCNGCPDVYYELEPQKPTLPSLVSEEKVQWEPAPCTAKAQFPPPPATMRDVAHAVRDYCSELAPDMIEESACCVCGQLTKKSSLTVPMLSEEQKQLLVEPECTRKECESPDGPISSIPGPVLVPDVEDVCNDCLNSLEAGKRPRMALANWLWVGEVLLVLKGLTLAEQSLILRVRYSRCIVKVSNGHAKMIANIVAFEHLTLKIYELLPIPLKELDEVLAVIFTGVREPSEDDLKRTPVLIHRNRVKLALEWLKLNHSEYSDLTIDYNVLNTYPLSNVPVGVLFNQTPEETEGNTLPSALSQFDNETEVGTSTGPCPFTVHGLTIDKFETMTVTERKEWWADACGRAQQGPGIHL
jgi:hypothetical protein